MDDGILEQPPVSEHRDQALITADSISLDSTSNTSDQRSDLQTTGSPLRPSRKSRKGLRKANDSDDEPLVDKTAALTLHSKKLERKQKRQQKRSSRRKVHSDVKSYLDLPDELFSEILSHLLPSDVMKVSQVNHDTRDFILNNETWIARDIIERRYWILSRSLQLPVPANQLDAGKYAALLSPRWQARIGSNSRNPYQHVRRIEPQITCCCSTCHLAWNNLCVALDLAHWQKDLNSREPIPRIERGKFPAWNVKLLVENASIVEKAMYSPLMYARILEIHLATIVSTILRFAKYRRKGEAPPPRLYRLTDKDIEQRSDAFLARPGPSSYEFPFWRDNYYGLNPYVPNRKWSKETERWLYPPPYPKQHEFDLEWASRWFRQDPELEQRMDEYVERLKQQLSR